MSAKELEKLDKPELARHAQEGWDLSLRLREEILGLKETNGRLNRRCQQAESAAAVNVEAVMRAGGSLGRALAGWAAGDYKRQLEASEAEVREIRISRDEILGLLRDVKLKHGTCLPRSRKACTNCSAQDRLDKIVGDWKGPRVELSDLPFTSKSRQKRIYTQKGLCPACGTTHAPGENTLCSL